MKGSDLGIVNSLINKKVKDTDVGNLANEIKDVKSQLEDNAKEKQSEKINALYPPIGYNKIIDNTDILENLQNLISNFKHVFVPKGNYTLSGTITIPENHYLDIDENATFNILNNKPVFNLGGYCRLDGGNIKLPSNHNTGVIYLTNISNYNKVKNIKMVQDTKSNPDPEIGTAIGILFDCSDENFNIYNCYQMFNEFDNIQADWCGCVVKQLLNSKPYTEAPWTTSNSFTNITAWHTYQIVDVGLSFGGNLLNNIKTQCGIRDTLLYKCSGRMNVFNNLIYYDLPPACKIVEFDDNSRLNTFNLWFENEIGYRAIYTDKGNSNTITKLGGFLEYPKDLTLENGWVNKSDSDSNRQKAQYYKSNLKEVRLRGRVADGSIGQVIATLPNGYRPNKHLFFPVATSDRTLGVVTILYTGTIIAYGASVADITLDGICFRTDV